MTPNDCLQAVRVSPVIDWHVLRCEAEIEGARNEWLDEGVLLKMNGASSL